MKTTILGLMLFGIAGSALAVGRSELDDRIRTLTTKFAAMQQDPVKGIPAETLRKAKGIVLLDRTKAGVVFAYQGGSGVAMVKDSLGHWSPAAFLRAQDASLGAQIGGQQSFIVMVFMSTNFDRWLTEQQERFGAGARGTAGDSTSGVESETVPQEPSVLIYESSQGLYGGAAVKGGSIMADDKANSTYYGQPLTINDILFGKKVKPSEATLALVERINAAGSKQASR
jgi:lipid-binding SYLF domain-containing protein